MKKRLLLISLLLLLTIGCAEDTFDRVYFTNNTGREVDLKIVFDNSTIIQTLPAGKTQIDIEGYNNADNVEIFGIKSANETNTIDNSVGVSHMQQSVNVSQIEGKEYTLKILSSFSEICSFSEESYYLVDMNNKIGQFVEKGILTKINLGNSSLQTITIYGGPELQIVDSNGTEITNINGYAVTVSVIDNSILVY